MTDTASPITGPTPAPITGPTPDPMFDSGPLEGPREGLPTNTEPHHAPIFDTGPHPDPLQPASRDDSPDAPQAPGPQAFSESESVDTDAFLRSVTGHLPPVVIAAKPLAVPGTYQFVKRWRFALIVAGVWVLAAAAGLGFYFWWYTSLDKTLPVLGILLYVVAAMVASLLVSMIPDRPHLTALAIALMAIPLASMAAAALLHGAYYFEWIARPAIG